MKNSGATSYSLRDESSQSDGYIPIDGSYYPVPGPVDRIVNVRISPQRVDILDANESVQISYPVPDQPQRIPAAAQSTTRIIKVIFGLSIIAAGLTALAVVITSFAGGTFAVLGALILAPIVFLLHVIMSRVWLDVVIALFKVAEHTARGRSAGVPPMNPPQQSA